MARVVYDVTIRRAVDLGADLIVAQGVESGGHVWSTVSTMVLVPLVCDAVPGVPVVAAEGIADERGIRAALALGAQGVWLGTRVFWRPDSTIWRARADAGGHG